MLPQCDQKGARDLKVEKLICYNCGLSGHHQAQCKNPTLCYSCKQASHISTKYPLIEVGRDEKISVNAGLELCGYGFPVQGFYFLQSEPASNREMTNAVTEIKDLSSNRPKPDDIKVKKTDDKFKKLKFDTHKRTEKQEGQDSSTSTHRYKEDNRNTDPKDLGDIQESGENALFEGVEKLSIPEFADGLSEEEVDDIASGMRILDNDSLGVDLFESGDDDKKESRIDKSKQLVDMSLHMTLVPTEPQPSFHVLKTCHVEPLILEGNFPLADGDIQLPEENNVSVIFTNKKQPRRKKEPAVAVRHSSWIKRDGIPTQVKAQQRVDQMNISDWGELN
ncbi:hypothetical protein ABZP36_034567 [Zizania latifolia]